MAMSNNGIDDLGFSQNAIANANVGTNTPFAKESTARIENTMPPHSANKLPVRACAATQVNAPSAEVKARTIETWKIQIVFSNPNG